jgi:diguanylate cyclase (GGDEF)-like protein
VTVAALQQLLLFALESGFVGFVLLAAYRLRDRIGPAPAYVLFGIVFLYASFFAEDFYIEVTPWLGLAPGCTVLLPAVLFFVLVVHLTSGAVEARRLIYGVSLTNIALLPIGLFAALQLRSPAVVNPYHLVPALFTAQPRIMIASATVLLFDTLLIVLTYECVSRSTRSIYLRVALALMITLAFDSLVFVTLTEIENPAYGDLLLSQIVGKTVAALLYAGVMAAYLQWFRVRGGVVVGAGQTLPAMLRFLTYRQRYEELRQLLIRDPLTNVYNRRYFDETLPRSVDDAREAGTPLCLMMVDVDHFKDVNDRYGHAEGDVVLQRLARAMAAMLRTSDAVCRYGGEEFTILLPAVELATATALAERVRAAIPAACADGWQGATELPVTVTIGVASFPADATTDRDLLRTADRRLYAGKAAGRNRVIASDPLTPATVAPPLRRVVDRGI